jgi:hypothetical protein
MPTDPNRALVINDEILDQSRVIAEDEEAVDGNGRFIATIVRDVVDPTVSDVHPAGTKWINTATNSFFESLGGGQWATDIPQDVLTTENKDSVDLLAGYAVARTALGVVRADQTIAGRVAVGIVLEDAEPDAGCKFQSDGRVYLADWTNAIGSTLLTPGTKYWLSTDGTLATIPGIGTGAFIQPVGRAMSTTVLELILTPMTRL